MADKPTTTTTVSIDIDLTSLSSQPDERLAMLWHVAQHNPVPFGDEVAGQLVKKIGQEIIRRWLVTTPATLYHHQERDYHWHQLTRFAVHRDGDWHPDPDKLATYEAQQAQAADGGEG